jgi:hypothetical protein
MTKDVDLAENKSMLAASRFGASCAGAMLGDDAIGRAGGRDGLFRRRLGSRPPKAAAPYIHPKNIHLKTPEKCPDHHPCT